jgi:hypothetical protein
MSKYLIVPAALLAAAAALLAGTFLARTASPPPGPVYTVARCPAAWHGETLAERGWCQFRDGVPIGAAASPAAP